MIILTIHLTKFLLTSEMPIFRNTVLISASYFFTFKHYRKSYAMGLEIYVKFFCRHVHFESTKVIFGMMSVVRSVLWNQND